MGLAVDPGYPTRPYVYVLYAYNHILGDSDPAPRWPSADALVPPGSKYDDRCPNPPQGTADGCVISGRLSRLTVSGGVMTGSEHVLVEDWCQQYPSHSLGALQFGPEGALYASGGEGASFGEVADYGQLGGTLPGTPTPVNPCGDPGGSNPTRRPRKAERFAPRTCARAAIRRRSVARSSGSTPTRAPAWPTTPPSSRATPTRGGSSRYGLRNPYRFTVQPVDRPDLDRRRGLQHLGGAQPARRSRRGAAELRLAVLRGGGRPAGVRGPRPDHLREPRAVGRDRAYYAYNHGASIVGERRLRCRQLVDLGAGVPAEQHLPRRRTTGRCSSPTTRAAASG